jgi:uncharacterized protein involved in exopolysaccharide biosynthesis
MADLNSPSTGTEAPSESEEISVIDLLITLAKHKKLLLGLPFGAAVLAAIVTLLLPNVYTATAKILPPQQSQPSAMATLGQLGALANIAGAGGALKNPNDIYIGMLRSRTLADRLIARFDLKKVYGKDTLTATRAALEEASRVSYGKEGIISIDVDDRDPKRAAALANAYVDELYQLTQTLAVTEASQRRLFFEKQLQLARSQLTEAEVVLRKTQEETGLIKLDDQGKAIIEAFARLRAEVVAKEVQLGAMRSFATESNPDRVRVQQELAELRSQLAKMENNKTSRGDVLMPTGQVPGAGLEYVRKLRDVKYYEAIFELLAKQYEAAKVDEARDTSMIQVLDKAIEPEKRSKPQRTLTVLLTGMVVALLSLVLVFVLEAVERLSSDSRHAERLRILRRHTWGT